jgi:hypothetical protein
MKLSELESISNGASRVPQCRWSVGLIVLVTAAAGCSKVASDDHASPVIKTKPTTVASAHHPVHIRTPQGAPVVASGLRDQAGEAITVSCQHCHTTRPPNQESRATADLDEFHQGLQLNHGQQACVACHDPRGGYGNLRLADGKAVEFAEVMTLCAQCHGPQYRDYQHGSHGGMNGYWDLSRGPRQRNNCIDCHDPHAPQFPRVQPAPGPQPPRLTNTSSSHAATHE